MARPAANRPTDGELALLNILWDRGPSTVRQVYDVVNRIKPTGYTSVLKLMQIMFDKDLLARDESNRSHVYRPKKSAEHTQKKLIKDLVDKAFGGSAYRLVQGALSGKKTPAREINKIRRLLDEIQGDSK